MRSVRIFYKKFGNMKFVSHLDINRFMIRVVRMSRIPVWYSEGFNPHPYITFALPLSLGFDSEYEVVDIRLDQDDYPNEMVFEKLKELMPEGIAVFDCGDPIMKAGEVAFADFRINFDNLSFKDELDSFLSSETIYAEKKTKKGGTKLLDLKEYINNFSFDDNSLILTLAAGGSNNLNPKLLLDAFEAQTGLELPAVTITRTMLYNEKMEKFK